MKLKSYLIKIFVFQYFKLKFIFISKCLNVILNITLISILNLYIYRESYYKNYNKAYIYII